MTKPKDNAEPSGASGGYGNAGSLVFGGFIAAAFIFCIVIATTLATGLLFLGKGPKPVPKPQGYVTVCSGCGTEFWSPAWGGPPKPITKCPNCPMSEEEWEALKEQMRKRTEKP